LLKPVGMRLSNQSQGAECGLSRVRVGVIDSLTSFTIYKYKLNKRKLLPNSGVKGTTIP